MTDRLLRSIDPSGNAVVHAAAGTGKTWLLTSRIVRLLMAGAQPGAIVAITFTRKAAQEMADRVHRRLFDMAGVPDEKLGQMLLEIGIAPERDSLATARALYERVLTSPHTLRTTTFHAFCQELLQRFAFEAGIAPGFEVVEDNAELRRQAWQALTHGLTQAAAGQTVEAMDTLLRTLGSLTSVREALYDFLDHCSDWWAYTEGADDPLTAAIERLTALYGPIDSDPCQTLLAQEHFRVLCHDFIDAASPRPETSLRARLRAAEGALSAGDRRDAIFATMVSAFLTQKGTRRVLAKSAGKRTAAKGQTLAEIHDRLCDALEDTIEKRKTAAAFLQTGAWYRCGAQLLAHYQQLKQERGQLDFADLEWLTYRLLTSGDHAEWVQYKLDQRIDHLLIDEFQDTNPTQWRLLLPLLQELAAGDPERRRSVFLVGDEKQSIYRFRRAEPQLFQQAHDWLVSHTQASAHTQDDSWRSSPAILAFINQIFSPPHRDLADAASAIYSLPDFRPHTAHYAARPGYVELRPLIERDDRDNEPKPGKVAFRNPLTTPRESDEDRRYRDEAAWIADRIRSLIDAGIGIETHSASGSSVRRVRYGDILVLLRDRAHAQAYEDALRDAGIPFLGASRGQFQDALEIRDLTNLLRVLVSPQDDLALAGVLRSPLFAFTDEALMALAAEKTRLPWWQRLGEQATRSTASDVVTRTWRLLDRWRTLADRVPVHDLLDRIFFEGDVLARYDSAVPGQLRARVQANIKRFIALALEFDSGRYPSLSRFIRTLETGRPDSGELPADASLTSPDDGVRVLTIHAAKGLEAPVVFLADAARGGTPRARVPWTLIDWPVETAGPTRMLLGGHQDRLDRIGLTVHEAQRAAAQREEANLLYVAMTRARQMLFLSGCAPTRGAELGWYGFIQKRLQHMQDVTTIDHVRIDLQRIESGEAATAVTGTFRFGVMPEAAAAPPPPVYSIVTDTRLHHPFEIDRHPARRRPSERLDDQPQPTGGAGSWRDPRARGIVIHRALDLATSIADRESAHQQLLREFAHTIPASGLKECWQEALAVIDAPALRDLFDPSQYREARNELPLLYRDGDDDVYGFIDRIVRTESTVTIIDYKSNRVTSADDLTAVSAHYAPQLELYARGLARIWPAERLRAVVVFTSLPQAIDVPLAR